jgi:hypothetical protein
MPTAEDDRMIWLTDAHAIIKAWDEQRSGGRLASVSETALLADAIATALQQAYELGKAAQSD